MFIRFILFLVIFWLVYHFLRKWIVGPFRQGYQEGQRGQGGNQREGKITINYRPQSQKGSSSSRSGNVGEYVDYEEVKEEPEQRKGEGS
jgi:hypothetical protein